MTSEAPGVLTAAMVRAAVARASSLPESAVEVVGFSGAEGAARGESYTTVMRAVTVKARVPGWCGRPEEQTHHFMVKTVPQNKVRAEWLDNAAMFEREVTVYFEILPALRRINGIVGDIKVPRAFYGDAEKGVLIMEDLKRQGFSIQDKRDEYDKKNDEKYAACMRVLLETWTEFGEDEGGVTSKLTKFNQAGVAAFMKQRLATREETFNCLIHNDVWVNNCMFKDGDVRLVDLQMFRRGNPSVDLAYLLGTSTSPEMRREHLDSILRLYHKELDGNLANLGYRSNMYPFDAFLRDFKHTYFFGIILRSLHSMLNLAYQESSDAVFNPDVQSVEEMDAALVTLTEAARAQMKDNERLRERMLALVREGNDYGYFD